MTKVIRIEVQLIDGELVYKDYDIIAPEGTIHETDKMFKGEQHKDDIKYRRRIYKASLKTPFIYPNNGNLLNLTYGSIAYIDGLKKDREEMLLILKKYLHELVNDTVREYMTFKLNFSSLIDDH